MEFIPHNYKNGKFTLFGKSKSEALTLSILNFFLITMKKIWVASFKWKSGLKRKKFKYNKGLFLGSPDLLNWNLSEKF